MITYFVFRHLHKIPAELIGLQADTEFLDKRHRRLSEWDLNSVTKNRSWLYRNSFFDYFDLAKESRSCTAKSKICGIM